uniref:Uncharacterized protein n=1 Tax=Mola mola TaxID=94237 RepID=A0A3Q3W052_MOLML
MSSPRRGGLIPQLVTVENSNHQAGQLLVVIHQCSSLTSSPGRQPSPPRYPNPVQSTAALRVDNPDRLKVSVKAGPTHSGQLGALLTLCPRWEQKRAAALSSRPTDVIICVFTSKHKDLTKFSSNLDDDPTHRYSLCSTSCCGIFVRDDKRPRK